MKVLVSNFDQVKRSGFDFLVPLSRITGKRVSLEENYPLVVIIEGGTAEDLEKTRKEYPDLKMEEVPS
jgi:hypothetical protein